MDEVLVIGGSAVGTAAGIYLARRNMKFRLISSDWGGEVATSGEIGNWPGEIITDGIKLSEEFLAHLRSYKIEPELNITVTAVKKVAEGHFVVEGEKEGTVMKYEAKAVVVGSGSHPRELNVPGEKEFRAKGLSYCTVCDGPLFSGKAVAIVGGGDSANEAGIMMNEIASKVYVITKNPDMKGDPSLIARLKSGKNVTVVSNAATARIVGDQFVNGVEYEDVNTKEKKTIAVQGVFIHIGMIPNSNFLPAEVSKNPYGEVSVDKFCATSVPGIFAAGDVTDVPYKQIGIAVGQGITAALSAVSYVNKLSL